MQISQWLTRAMPSRIADSSECDHELPSSSHITRHLIVRVSIVAILSLIMILGVSPVDAQEISEGQSDTSKKHAGSGRWKKFRKNSVIGTQQSGALTEEQLKQIRQLEALGYVEAVAAAPPASGVTINLEDLTWPGLNFYVSGHDPVATLIDMDGKVIHTWSYDFDGAFPGMSTKYRHWRRAYLYENGDILALWEGRGLIRLDKDSRLKWRYGRKPHHDIFVTEDGNIYVLSRTASVVPEIHATQPMLENFIDLLDENGKLLKRLSILDCFRNSEYGTEVIQRLRDLINRRMKADKPRPGDVLHTNTITELDGSQARISPAFRKGNLLISLRIPSILAIIDPAQEKVVWSATGMWKHQHDPLLLENGRMLLFDNDGQKTSSRVIEFDPFTQEIFWKFDGQPPGKFYSRCCGTVQRLPNGNTLIAETDNGRALEVAADGTVVWEFISPHRAGKNNELIAALFDVVRIPTERTREWLDN